MPGTKGLRRSTTTWDKLPICKGSHRRSCHESTSAEPPDRSRASISDAAVRTNAPSAPSSTCRAARADFVRRTSLEKSSVRTCPEHQTVFHHHDNFARNRDWELLFDRLIELRAGDCPKIGFTIQDPHALPQDPEFHREGRAGRRPPGVHRTGEHQSGQSQPRNARTRSPTTGRCCRMARARRHHLCRLHHRPVLRWQNYSGRRSAFRQAVGEVRTETSCERPESSPVSKCQAFRKGPGRPGPSSFGQQVDATHAAPRARPASPALLLRQLSRPSPRL